MRNRPWLWAALAVLLLGGGLGAVALFDTTPARARSPAARDDRAPRRAQAERARAESARRFAHPARRRTPRAAVAQAAPRPPLLEIARLRGGVIVPGDGEVALEELRVRADDGTRTLEGRPGDEPGSFAFDLRPGRYTLTAEAGDFVGVEQDVLAIADDEREVRIALELAGPVAGRVTGAFESDDVEVQAFRAGTEIEAGTGSVEAGAFSVRGLRAGHAYDLVFRGAWFTDVTLRGVRAPADGLEVALSRLAALRGAFGVAPDEGCPIQYASVATGTTTHTTSVANDCRFEFPIPRDASEVKVSVSGPGWDLEQRVAIPSEGDPEPLCFRPPCREEPVLRSLELTN